MLQGKLAPRQHRNLTPSRRILIIKLADLGDLLSITPALRALRNGLPGAHISALVTPSSACLLDRSDLVDEIIPFDKFAFDRKRDAYRGVPNAVGLANELRSRHFDALVGNAGSRRRFCF